MMPSHAILNSSDCNADETGITDVVAMFRQTAKAQPDVVAIEDDRRSWTYGEVLSSMSSIGQHLQTWIKCQDDVRLNDRVFVGLCLDHSAEAIVSMLGVMDASLAFVPLDPQYPPERLATMIADAPISLIITSADNHGMLSKVSKSCLELGNTMPQWINVDQWIDSNNNAGNTSETKRSTIKRPQELNVANNDSFTLDPDSLAYVMYTSGSTGQPKGVAISHRALMTYCLADEAIYQLQHNDRTLQFSTLNFDIAIEEIFPPLVSGSTVVVRPSTRSQSANELSEIVRERGITAIHLATAYWHSWVELMKASQARVPDCLRLMVVTGEKVSVPHYRDWLQLCDHDVLWANAYGPTEATVSATVFIPPRNWTDGIDETTNMPIGFPLPGYDAFILDANHHQCAIGQTGQLFIGGPALASEYLHRPDLTDQAFQKITVEGDQRRLYATGDLARWLPDGQIDFAGRVDHQIKLGSYRIEPGEIEAACNSLPCVIDSVVGVSEDGGQKRLHVYLAIGEEALSTLQDEPDHARFAADVVDQLRDCLPTYMIPNRFVLMSAFPTTINGKIDRKHLPNSASAITARRETIAMPETNDQIRMAKIWQEILGVEQVSIDDDFFQLGGSSLLVTQVIAKWSHAEHRPIPVRDFFANPTIRSITRCLTGSGDSSSNVAVADTTHRCRVESAFIRSSVDGLHVIWTHPEGQSRQHAVMIESGWGHEWTRGYRNLQQLSMLLARHGFTSIRIDHAGVGQSSGNELTQSHDTFATDLSAVIEETNRRCDVKQISMVGLRLGGNAILEAQPLVSETVRNLGWKLRHTILWDAIESGQAWLSMLDQFHREILTNHTRFCIRRRSDGIDEALGMTLNQKRRSWIESIGLDAQDSGANDCHFIWSKGTRADSNRPQTGTHHHITDDIAWDRLDCVDVAFASPQAFAKVRSILETGR